MNNGYPSVVSLNHLHMKMHLGVTDAEQDVAQDVTFSFKLFFAEKPKGCLTDNIDDTVCYHKIANILTDYCKEHRVRLLEYVCYALYEKVKEIVGNDIKIWIKVEKCNPPIEGLRGSTSFEYSDLKDSI